MIPFSVHFSKAARGSAYEKQGTQQGDRDAARDFYQIEEKLNLAGLIFGSNDHGESA